jgi:nitroreductase
MDVFEAISGRQSVSKVQQTPVPQDVVEKLLKAAVQAPNHHRVRPWRFFVLEGEARERLGEAMAQGLLKRQPESPVEMLGIERKRPLRAPLLVAVAVDLPADPKVVLEENICAAAAAVQNLLLAAHALGLGAMWRTGPAATDPQVKAFFGLSSETPLIGFIYVGYPEAELPAKERPGFEDRVTWM